MEPTAEVDLDMIRMVGGMLRFARAIDHHLRYALHSDLGVRDLSVLAQVGHGTALPSLIARELWLDPPRVTRIVDRLVMLGYVMRQADSLDRRRSLLSLTPLGGERLGSGKREISQSVAWLMAQLTGLERQGLEHGLRAVRRVVDTLQVEDDPLLFPHSQPPV
jgi:DNA-binding MarR family transcriptional regulator